MIASPATRSRLGRSATPLLAATVLFPVALGCGVAAEVGEATLAVELRPANAEQLELQNVIEFADGARLSEIRLSPPTPEPGQTVHVAFELQGAAGGAARVGLLPPVDAARQFITAMGAAPTRGAQDPRGQWQSLTLGESHHALSFELPADWNPRSAVFVLERRAGDEGPAVEVVAGPRAEAVRTDGYRPGVRAILGTLTVATHPLRCTVPRASERPQIDGVLDEAQWAGEGMRLVHSLEGEPVLHNASRVWFAWDDQALYVAAKLDDDDIWSEYEARDDPLYRQEAFELFVAGGPSVEKYLEYQVSARNVVFDAAFQGRRNGDEGFNGMWEHAVQVDGTVNERRDIDRGWSVEMSIAWPEICAQTRMQCPPQQGSALRMNAFRLDKDKRGRQTGQALTPTREPDFHNWKAAAFVTLGGAP